MVGKELELSALYDIRCVPSQVPVCQEKRCWSALGPVCGSLVWSLFVDKFGAIRLRLLIGHFCRFPLLGG